MGFPGLMPTELLLVGFLDQVKLLTVLEFVLTNTKLKRLGIHNMAPLVPENLPFFSD